ncbi:MAG: ribonucleoside-diphosphate reductase, adenosylcobalamin-dependent, partial [Thermoproteus sp.]|nr:ribonucleoside-diphosphate reductase, adenosylcobalamin-dependent [Thermoproteus sp.]
MAVGVIKASGAKEPFSPDKLKASLRKAAEDVGVGVNGEVSVAPKSDVTSYELSDLIELELLRKSIERPDYAKVATSHLLGKIYKDVLGKEYLRRKSVERYAAGWREALKSLAELKLLKEDAPKVAEWIELDPGFDRRLSYNALRLFTNGNYALRRPDGRLAETPAMAGARVAAAVARSPGWARRYYELIAGLKFV